jgi:hypothetical protein
VYQADSTVDSTKAATAAIGSGVTALEREVISGIKVYTWDAEFELDDDS